MVRREIQRFEIVVIGFDHRSLSNRIAEIAKDGDDFVHGADDRVLRADGAADSGEGDVERSRDKIRITSKRTPQTADIHPWVESFGHVVLIWSNCTCELDRG